MKKILTASCLCKGIKFKTSGEHRNVSNCHCIQCRKTHGIYGSYSNVKDKDIKFITRCIRNLFKFYSYIRRQFFNISSYNFFYILHMYCINNENLFWMDPWYLWQSQYMHTMFTFFRFINWFISFFINHSTFYFSWRPFWLIACPCLSVIVFSCTVVNWRY